MKEIQITTKNFKLQLAGAVKKDVNLREQVQRLLVFAFLEYDVNHNSNWLSDIMNAGFKGIRLAAIQEYVQDHTDLVWTKKKDDTTVFMREALEGFEFKLPEKSWYEYSNKGMSVPIVDPDKLIATLKATLKAVLAGEGKKVLKEGTKERATQILAAVEVL